MVVGRTFLAGAVSIEKGRLREAKRRPFLGLYVEGTNGDIYVREFSLSGLRLRKSAYHESRAVWFFNAELHDDDLPNASFDPLRKYLETVPSVPGVAFVAARDDWQEKFSWFALVLDGHATISFVSNQPDERARAMDLIARLKWQPAYELLESL